MAKALGFKVEMIHCPDGIFVHQVSSLCPGIKALAPLPGRLRQPTRLPDIVFSDALSFPTGPDATEYWTSWSTPHLFYDLGAENSIDGTGGVEAWALGRDV